MAGTSIAAARGALFSLLDAAIATPPTDVTYGLPRPAENEGQEVVAMLGLEAPTEEPASLGTGNRRLEVYDIIVAVKVYQPEGDGQSVDERAFALVDTVRSTVFANKSLTQTVDWAEPVAARTDGPVPLEQGYIEIVECPIRCHARKG